MTTLSSPLPILSLTIRQFLGGKAFRVVAVLALIPALFALIYLLNPDVASARQFLADTIFLNLVTPTLLPITVLILATGALGNEVEDRTLPYLTLKPVSRLRIVIEKLAGVLMVALPVVWAGLSIAFLLVARSEAADLRGLLWAMLAGATVGVVGIASIFLLIGLVVPRALLVGIVYALVWESLLGRFLPGVRVVSIRHYAQSVFVNVLNDPGLTIGNAASTRTSLITIAVAGVAAIALATWRLRRMDLP